MIQLEQATSSVTLVAPEFAELTAANADSFKRRMVDLIEDGHSRIVIDMGSVSVVDSAGIGALVGLLKRIGLRGEMVLCGLSDRVGRAFQLTRMDRIFPIHADRTLALRAMGG